MPANIQPEKPDFDQESVWDYPRPPRVESVSERIRVIFNDEIIADSVNTFRVLETSHPPCFYIPTEDIIMSYLKQTDKHTFCEFKGLASYYSVTVGKKNAHNAAWFYPSPGKGFEVIKDHVSFYAYDMDACYVGDEKVKAQTSNFYGGWITSKVVGPFKGGAGTQGW